MSAILMDPITADAQESALYRRALERTGRNEVFALDRDLRYVYFNPAHARRMEEACGAVPQIAGSMIDLVADAATRGRLYAALERALAGETQRSLSWWSCGATGDRAMDCTFEPVGAPGGRPIGVVVVMRESNQSEGEAGAFRALERRYEALLQSSADGIVVLDGEGVVLEANAAFARLIGAPLDTVLTSGWERWAVDDSRDRTLRVVGHCIDHERRFETVLRRENGSFVAAEIVSAPIQMDGRPAALLNVRDITDRHRRESALAESEGRLRTIFQHAPTGLAVIDLTTGRPIEINDALLDLFGRSAAEVGAASLGAYTHPDDQVEDRGLIRQLIDGTINQYQIQKRFVHADGTSVPVQVRAVRLPTILGRPPMALGIVTDLREIAHAEASLRESEGRLRAIFEHAPVGLAIIDLSTRQRLEVNDAMLAIFGRPRSEVCGAPLKIYSDPDDRDDQLDQLVAGTITNYKAQRGIRQPDGAVVPVEVKAVRLPPILGRPPMALGMVTDLRDIAQAEASLRESEEKYRRLAENAEDVIYRFRLDDPGRIEYISAAVETVLGFTPAACYADPELPFRQVHAEDRDRLLRLLSGQEDPSGRHLIRWRHADGRTVHLEHRGRLVRHDDGSATVEGIARDVSEQIQSEERLRLLGRVLEQAAEVVLITDRAGRIQYVNEAFERVTGYARSEVIGLNPRILKSGCQDQEFYARMWATLRAGDVFAATVKNRRKDGTLYDAEINVSPVRNAAGAVTHYVGLQRDVTRERERAEQLRQAQKMEAMGQVTGGIAHDFNNLLTVILASAELIAPELPSGSDLAVFNQDLLDAARHGSTLVRQLLAFGRKELLTPGPLDLNPAVGEFSTVLRRLLPESITLLPVTGVAPIAFADRGAVEQILLNLATNARDAMPDGGTLAIELGSRQVPEGFEEGTPDTTFATLTVRDTGSGMDAITKRRALEPFFTTKPLGKGTGLGLPMVLGTMQQLGGWVEIDSTPGTGTAITLGFGLGGSVVASAPVAVAPTPRGTDGHARIMLVEDSVQLRRVATRTLEHLGYEVVSAEDGEAGWELWRTLRSGVDLVLTDAVMPKLSGSDLIRRIRGTGSAVPIVLASGYSSEEFADLEGQVTLVSKPWTVESLRDKLAGALARKSA